MTWDSWRRLIVFGLISAVISFFDASVAKKMIAVVMAGLLIVAAPKIAPMIESATQ